VKGSLELFGVVVSSVRRFKRWEWIVLQLIL